MAFPVGWLMKCPIVIQRTLVPADQTAFPVLLTEANLPAGMLTGPNAAQADGGDIRFSTDSAGAAQIPCEIAVWNPAGNRAEIWVPVDILTASDVTIYVWYSAGGGQTQPAPGAPLGSLAVWGPSYRGVWHMTSPGPNLQDSTVYGNNGTNVGGVTSSVGKIDGGAASASGTAYITIGSASTLMPAGSYTLSAWVFLINLTNTPGLFLSPYQADLNAGYNLVLDGTGRLYLFQDTTGTGTNVSAQSAVSLTIGSWFYVAGVWDGANLQLYINGAADGTAAAASIGYGTVVNPGQLMSYPGQNLSGIMDEVHFSPSIRSANWILTEYNNQNVPGAFALPGIPISLLPVVYPDNHIAAGLATGTFSSTSIGGFN